MPESRLLRAVLSEIPMIFNNFATVLAPTLMSSFIRSLAIFMLVLRVQRKSLTGSPATSDFINSSI